MRCSLKLRSSSAQAERDSLENVLRKLSVTCECDRVVTGLWSDITREFWLIHWHSALSWTWDSSGQTGQIKLMIAFLHCPLPPPAADVRSDPRGVGWPQVSPSSSLPNHIRGVTALSAGSRGEHSKHIPDFWTVCPLPVGSNCHKLERLTTCLLWPLCLNFVFPKLGLPPSHSHQPSNFCILTFLFHNKSYLASPGERSATLQQFLVFAWKSLTPKKEAFFPGDGYLELNIWNSNQSNENFVRS